MKIGFDISQTAHLGGVATYARNLAEQLALSNDLEVVFFYSSLRKPYQGSLPNVKSFLLPPTFFEKLFNQVRIIKIEKFIGPIDIFHSSDWVQPPTKAKKITTYHDVIPLKYPEWSDPKIIKVHKKRLALVEKEVDVVIAVSETTKNDLIEVSNISEKKIKVIYEAAGKEFRKLREEDVEKFRNKMKLPKKFVLAISGVGKRRNLDRVKQAARNYNLLIAGETIPWVNYQDLPLLYNCATVLLYPSFYEGFGLPILEAMSCGLPVITSNVSSMPEVGGEAPLYVDPNNLEDIESKLQEVMDDRLLREKLVKMGFQRASQFSWEKCAQETVRVYQQLFK